MKYSLPCSCGQTIPVEVGQAGQTVTCSCGVLQEVPAMRHVRQLEPVPEDTQARAKTKGKWSLLQRLLFAVGLGIAALGMLSAVSLQMSRSQLNTEEVKWDYNLDNDLQLLEDMNLEQAWESWKNVRDQGIGPYQPPQFVQERFVSDYWKKVALIVGSIGMFGVLLMVIACFLPRQKDPFALKRPPRK